jgi:hypothetical protein
VYILKQIRKVELEGFLDFAPQYFGYINKVKFRTFLIFPLLRFVYWLASKKIKFKYFLLNLVFFCFFILTRPQVFHKQVPTALAKVFGVYTVVYKNQAPCYVVVMENLFCGRNIVKKFDLKGSLRYVFFFFKPQLSSIYKKYLRPFFFFPLTHVYFRSRHASGEVLLDENLLERTFLLFVFCAVGMNSGMIISDLG